MKAPHRVDRHGQFLVSTAVMASILILGVSTIAYQVLLSRQDIPLKPVKEITEAITASFREAMAAALANLTYEFNQTGNLDAARGHALEYLSRWKLAALTAYADSGLQINYMTPLFENSSYVLQAPKTIYYGNQPEEIYSWDLYNLSQLYWDQSSGCSASYATLCINLTEYGFYGWMQDVTIAANATMYPDSMTSESDREPADIVLVLDSSGSMFFQPYNAGPNDDQNDYTLQLTGSIAPSLGWQTVGAINLGEIPTQFVATLTWSGGQNLAFQMANGSLNEQLVISYRNATGDYTLALQASADAYVRSRYPSYNYGTRQNLQVCGYVGDLYRTWVKFVLSTIPAGITITSAQLNLYITSNYQARSYVLQHSDTDSWGETAITWNNQPTSFSSSSTKNAPARGWISWDVTSDVLQDYDAHRESTSWSIKDSREDSNTRRYIVMNSRESVGIPGFNILTSTGSIGQKFVYSTSDGSSLPGSIQGNDFGSANMWKYGKNGKWMIQLQNPGPANVSYTVLVQTRKLDQVRNAATTFLRLLNPKLDRLAIVQFGHRSGERYYYAARISEGSDNSPFYDLDNQGDIQAALDDISWRTPQTYPIGYGFESYGLGYWWGGTTPLGAGLEVANRLFNDTKGARTDSRRMVIVITDGKENVRPDPPVSVPPGGPGTFYNPTPGVPSSYYSISSDLPGDAYKASNVTTITIGFGKDADGYALNELAKLGKGQYYFAANGTQLAQILASLAYNLKDEYSFRFSLKQEYKIGINYLSNSSLSVFFWDKVTKQRHKVTPSQFNYQGGGNFMVTVSNTGSQSPDAIDIVVKDPRGIIVRLRLDLKYWGS